MSQDVGRGETGGNLPQNRSLLLIALGSNMPSDAGSPVQVLQKAVAEIVQAGAVIRAESRYYVTPAVPAGSGPDFVNAALALEAQWSAVEAITILHGIEAKLGRRRTKRWGARIIDLDLLAVDTAIRPNMAVARQWMALPLEAQQENAPGQLILPHPRMHERAFVLEPLADVAPDWVHPILRKSVIEMRDALPPEARAPIVALD
ncbi:2-amino-4-hydroxy-6-hydroxymethyldihydropteridine diphosphokinase [uncultured Tateyamaria sp.]|uniref:2-amino-4-hydroxy-6- hydroxymethyldihydropteridine diphosphokinase n=1 Tax=uncultured Tateyamaria sp. TaxID=455651 RepID=UPI00262CC19E|nr:2-amino-4-hydroxy-6-hydroxymethyldihydropteridine diphosphokinase [uncultured Tateyamaria sp.]